MAPVGWVLNIFMMQVSSSRLLLLLLLQPLIGPQTEGGCGPTQTSAAVAGFSAATSPWCVFPLPRLLLLLGRRCVFWTRCHEVANMHARMHTSTGTQECTQSPGRLTVCESLLVCTGRCQSSSCFQLVNKGKKEKEEEEEEEEGFKLTYVLQMFANSAHILGKRKGEKKKEKRNGGVFNRNGKVSPLSFILSSCWK